MNKQFAPRCFVLPSGHLQPGLCSGASFTPPLLASGAAPPAGVLSTLWAFPPSTFLPGALRLSSCPEAECCSESSEMCFPLIIPHSSSVTTSEPGLCWTSDSLLLKLIVLFLFPLPPETIFIQD